MCNGFYCIPHSIYTDLAHTHVSTRRIKDLCLKRFVAPCTQNSFGDRSTLYTCCRSSCVERLAVISATGHKLQTFQAITERTQWLQTTTAHCDCVFVRLIAHSLTYLRTHAQRTSIGLPMTAVTMTTMTAAFAVGVNVSGSPETPNSPVSSLTSASRWS